PDAVVRLRFDELVTPVIRSKVVGSAFDSLLVATGDGRVIDQTGEFDQRITRLDTLTNVTDPKNPVKLTFDALGRSAGMVSVQISGSTYTLFSQPCCQRMAHDARDASASDGWVLCGLTADNKLSAESYAVPFSILMFAAAILLAGVLGWPFLRLTLIADSDRVGPHDVVLVGLCGLLGLGLVTLFVLDTFASLRLKALLDQGLAAFAQTIETNANKEIRAASLQLDTLEEVMTRLNHLGDSFGDQADPRWSYLTDADLSSYPWFESF